MSTDLIVSMKKTDLNLQFAERLKQAMIAAGYQSNRSMSGVDIHKLADITGHSQQICRKYLRGEVIPEPTKLAEISLKLKVSPGWLLFGDCHSNQPKRDNTITISKNLLHYIFSHASQLRHQEYPDQEVSNFLTDLTEDISQIQTNEDQSKKIVDIALGSIKHFVLNKES